MFKSSAFFNNNIKPTVEAIVSTGHHTKSLTFGSDTFYYIDNILRISLGNNNACVMYRDGSVDIGGLNTSFPYLGSVMYSIRDTFTPSTYATGNTQYKQMLLMENGDLILIDCFNKLNTTLLTKVDEFLTKNQAHRCDAIVALKTGELYHVWIGPSPVGPSADPDGNGTDSGVVLIPGILRKDVLFCSLGDAPGMATVCFKKDKRNLYNFIKGAGLNFKITGVQTTPIAKMALPAGEYYVDGMAQEFNGLFLTNKRVISKDSGITYGATVMTDHWTFDQSSTTGLFAKKIATPTSYSMIIEDIFGKFWLCDNPSNVNQQKPVRYTFFDNLKTHLDPIRKAMR